MTTTSKEQSVLVVDDSQGICQTMYMILKRKGFEVECAYDGPSALDKVKQRTYDVILLDIRLPGMDGVEVFKHIQEVRPGARVMVMTAYALPEKVSQAMELGVEHVFYKPLDMDELIGQIGNHGSAGPTGHPM